MAQIRKSIGEVVGIQVSLRVQRQKVIQVNLVGIVVLLITLFVPYIGELEDGTFLFTVITQ